MITANRLLKLCALSLAALVLSCSSKPKPREMNVGITLTNRAVNYELEGNESMAAYTYTRALAQFRNMGRFCDMARVSLLMYVTNPYPQNISKLDDAQAFSALGECEVEGNMASFLSGDAYDFDLLEEPYTTLALFARTKNIEYLESLASLSSTSNRIKSSLYRIAAKFLIAQDPEQAIKYAEKAKQIDGLYAWTKNILLDEEIVFKASEAASLPTAAVAERINILKQALAEKK